MSVEGYDGERLRPYRSISMDSSETQPLLSSTLSRRISAWRPVPEESIQNNNNELPPKPMASQQGNNVAVEGQEGRRQSSVVTIFAIWNTMMGTSLLAMPWGIERAGILLGASLVLLMAGLCLYTSYCNLRTHEQFGNPSGDISELARNLLGPIAEIVSKVFSLIVLLGANIVYWILMSNFLFHSVAYVHDIIEGTSEEQTSNFSYPSVLCPNLDKNQISEIAEDSTFKKIWNLEMTVPIFLTVIITPLLNFKSPTFFTKFNSFGTLSVFYLLIFILIKAIGWGIHADSIKTSTSYTPLGLASFPATSGMLALSFFIHNIIIIIMKNNSNQKNNARDLSIAYFLVTVTYLLIGVTFSITFPLIKTCIQDNLLNNFSGSDILTVLARGFLLFQLVTVFPLIAYMLRVQFLLAVTGRAFPGRIYVLLHNLVLVIICVLFAIFLPKIGTIIRFTGALSGLVHCFALPCLLRLAAQHKNGEIPKYSWCIHTIIPVFGAANLLGQFFVNDNA